MERSERKAKSEDKGLGEVQRLLGWSLRGIYKKIGFGRCFSLKWNDNSKE